VPVGITQQFFQKELRNINPKKFQVFKCNEGILKSSKGGFYSF
jgi:hypothetical protein